jgi:hypothetical protein
MEKAVISAEIPVDLNLSLENEAKSRLTSKSAVIREILLAHVNKQRALTTPAQPPTQPIQEAA